MIDVHELLMMKENDIVRIRKEIRALHIAAPLLLEPDEVQRLQEESGAPPRWLEDNASQGVPPNGESSYETNEVSQEPDPPKQSRLRNWLGLAAGE